MEYLYDLLKNVENTVEGVTEWTWDQRIKKHAPTYYPLGMAIMVLLSYGYLHKTEPFNFLQCIGEGIMKAYPSLSLTSLPEFKVSGEGGGFVDAIIDDLNMLEK